MTVFRPKVQNDCFENRPLTYYDIIILYQKINNKGRRKEITECMILTIL